MRLADWEDRLVAYIDERRSMTFAWGSHDCALFGAGAVTAMTGEDHGAAFRGTYDDAEGAARALREHGGGTIVRTFDLFLQRRPIAMARRGDLAMIGRGLSGSIGVVVGGVALFVSDVGYERRPRADWVRCWEV